MRNFTRIRPLLRAPPRRTFFGRPPPAQRPRSLKSSALRWGTAVGLVYWYNTSDYVSDLFSRPVYHELAPPELKTAIAETSAIDDALIPGNDTSIEELEGEAEQQGAFNPETGEINWDCPCLGGMGSGPCGEQFKAAFSCFVYSTEEPKGMDCIEKFKHMQDCFREHPDVYADELADPGDDTDKEVEPAVVETSDETEEKRQ